MPSASYCNAVHTMFEMRRLMNRGYGLGSPSFRKVFNRLVDCGSVLESEGSRLPYWDELGKCGDEWDIEYLSEKGSLILSLNRVY